MLCVVLPPVMSDTGTGTTGIERKITSVFVTGGSGFVGRELIRALHQYGVTDIRALVRSNTAAAALPSIRIFGLPYVLHSLEMID
jgi:FlaA1/EpsC-like NDP-sugar epimerase